MLIFLGGDCRVWCLLIEVYNRDVEWGEGDGANCRKDIQLASGQRLAQLPPRLLFAQKFSTHP